MLDCLDDVILVPALIWLAIRLLPGAAIEAGRADADGWLAADAEKPRSHIGAVAIVAIWMGFSVLAWRWLT